MAVAADQKTARRLTRTNLVLDDDLVDEARRLTGIATKRGVADGLIATFCIEHGHVLLHSDRDFDAFEQHLGLRVLHPSDDLASP